MIGEVIGVMYPTGEGFCSLTTFEVFETHPAQPGTWLFWLENTLQNDHNKSDCLALSTATLSTTDVIVASMLGSGCFGMKQGLKVPQINFTERCLVLETLGPPINVCNSVLLS